MTRPRLSMTIWLMTVMPAYPDESMESTNGNQFIGGIRRLPIAEPNASEIGAYTSKWLRDKVLMAAQRKESPLRRHTKSYVLRSANLWSKLGCSLCIGWYWYLGRALQNGFGVAEQTATRDSGNRARNRDFWSSLPFYVNFQLATCTVGWSSRPYLPDHPADGYNINFGNDCPLVPTKKIRLAVSWLSRGIATGLNRIPNEILSLIGKKSPDILAKMYNRCLRESVFSVTWKRARLLLLHKSPDKPVTNPYSFRLISMLDTVGKVFEKILLLRLNEHLDNTSGLSVNQFGFRRGCST